MPSLSRDDFNSRHQILHDVVVHLFTDETFCVALTIDAQQVDKKLDCSTLKLNETGVSIFFLLFCIRPPPGLLPVLGPLERYMTPTLGAALLCCSRACSDLGH